MFFSLGHFKNGEMYTFVLAGVWGRLRPVVVVTYLSLISLSELEDLSSHALSSGQIQKVSLRGGTWVTWLHGLGCHAE